MSDTLLGHFAYSINRALEFVVDRIWVDFLLLAIAAYLPTRDRESVPSELVYVIAASLVLFAVREYVLRPQYDTNFQLQMLQRDLLTQKVQSQTQGRIASKK